MAGIAGCVIPRLFLPWSQLFLFRRDGGDTIRIRTGDTIYLTLRSTAFSSAESHTGEQSGEFEIRITWD